MVEEMIKIFELKRRNRCIRCKRRAGDMVTCERCYEFRYCSIQCLMDDRDDHAKYCSKIGVMKGILQPVLNEERFIKVKEKARCLNDDGSIRDIDRHLNKAREGDGCDNGASDLAQSPPEASKSKPRKNKKKSKRNKGKKSNKEEDNNVKVDKSVESLIKGGSFGGAVRVDLKVQSGKNFGEGWWKRKNETKFVLTGASSQTARSGGTNAKDKPKFKDFYSDSEDEKDDLKGKLQGPTGSSESVQTSTVKPNGSSESVQTSTVKPPGSSDSIQTSTVKPTRSSESIQTSTAKPTRSSESVQTSTVKPTRSSESIQTSTVMPPASSESIQTSTVKPPASSESIQTSTVKPTRSSESVQTSTVKQTRSSESVQTSTVKPTRSSESIQTSTVKPTRSSESVQTSTLEPNQEGTTSGLELVKYDPQKAEEELKNKGSKQGSSQMGKCSYCKKEGIVLKCSRCKLACYCDKQCQVSHYQEHKGLCRLKDRFDTALTKVPMILKISFRMMSGSFGISPFLADLPDEISHMLFGAKFQVMVEIIAELPLFFTSGALVRDLRGQVTKVLFQDNYYVHVTSNPWAPNIPIHLSRCLIPGNFILLLDAHWEFFLDGTRGIRINDLDNVHFIFMN